MAEKGEQTEEDENSGENASSENRDDTASKDEQNDAGAESAAVSEPAAETISSDTVQETAGIVCWGDDLTNGNVASTVSYVAVLENLLAEKGYDLPVINKTIQAAEPFL